MATITKEMLEYLQSLGLGNTQMQGQENLLGIPIGQVTNPMANMPQDFANYQSIPMGAQYNPNIIGGAESPYARIMGLMNAMPRANLNPYAGLVGSTPAAGYNPRRYNPGGSIDYSGGGGGGGGDGGGGGGYSGGFAAADGVGMSGMGNSGAGAVADGNVANSITGLAQAADPGIDVSDMGTMSAAAAAEAGMAAADGVGMSGMGVGGFGGDTGGFGAADGVGMSGMGNDGAGAADGGYGDTGGYGGDAGGGGGGGVGGCFLTTAAVSHMGQKDNGKVLNALRDFRDTYMRKNKEKSKDVAWYYENAPRIVAALDERPDADKVYKKMYRDYIKPAYDAIQKGDDDRAYKIYKDIIDFATKQSDIDKEELTPRYGSNGMASGGLIGEYVIKKSAVKKYGRGLLDMINEGEVPVKKIKSLLD